MVFVETFGGFVTNFSIVFTIYMVSRSYVYFTRQAFQLLKENIGLRDKMGDLQYRGALSKLTASFWKQCYEHIIDQIGPYAKDKEATMEKADLALTEYLTMCREDMRKDMVNYCLDRAEDEGAKAYLMKKVDEMFPNN